MVHIPYAGGPPAQLALVSGQVDLNFDNLATASANIKSGKLKAVAMTTAKRSGAMPEVPTIAESGAAYGLAAFDINTWFGLFGPGWNAAGNDAAAEQGLHRRARLAGDQGAHGQPAGRSIADDAGAIRSLRQGRTGEVRTRGEGLWGQGELIASGYSPR
jgi:hypothetical protein